MTQEQELYETEDVVLTSDEVDFPQDQETPEEIKQSVLEMKQETETKQETLTPVFIHTKFGNTTTTINFLITATGQYGKTSATGGKLRLIHGRIYFLPINTEETVSSDNYPNIKIFSDMGDKIDVKFVNKGFAAVLPLQNNINLLDNTRLCVLW